VEIPLGRGERHGARVPLLSLFRGCIFASTSRIGTPMLTSSHGTSSSAHVVKAQIKLSFLARKMGETEQRQILLDIEERYFNVIIFRNHLIMFSIVAKIAHLDFYHEFRIITDCHGMFSLFLFFFLLSFFSY